MELSDKLTSFIEEKRKDVYNNGTEVKYIIEEVINEVGYQVAIDYYEYCSNSYDYYKNIDHTIAFKEFLKTYNP